MPSSLPEYSVEDLNAMTKDEFDDVMYKSYREIGGRKCRQPFAAMAEGFNKYTYDIFVGGELTYITRVTGQRVYIKDRHVAIKWFAIDFCGGDENEAHKVYRAVDNVISWT